MDLIDKLSDYAKAIRQASAHRPSSYPKAIFGVLQARLAYGLGPRMHSLFRLNEVDQSNWGSYVIDEQLRKTLRAINPLHERRVVNDKLEFFLHCQRHDIPTIPVLVAIQPPYDQPTHGPNHVATRTQFTEVLAGPQDRLFFKLTKGTWGQHAFIAERRNTLWHFAGRQGSSSDILQYCISVGGSEAGWIVQPLVTASPLLRSLNTGRALSTIRAVTCMDSQGNPELLHAVYRIPTGENVTDNFAHGSSGNLVAPIDTATGVLGCASGSTRRDWPEIVFFHAHPNTNEPIANFQIPYWLQLTELVKRAHSTLPGLKTLGWDVAIADKPIIVEANSTYDVDLIQVALNRGIRASLQHLENARLPHHHGTS